MKVIFSFVSVLVLGLANSVASDDLNPFDLPKLDLLIQGICKEAEADNKAAVDTYFGCYGLAKVLKSKSVKLAYIIF